MRHTATNLRSAIVVLLSEHVDPGVSEGGRTPRSVSVRRHFEG